VLWPQAWAERPQTWLWWGLERASSTFEQAWGQPQDIKTDKEKHGLRHKTTGAGNGYKGKGVAQGDPINFANGKMDGRTFGVQSLR
jgi:beta-mannanase